MVFLEASRLGNERSHLSQTIVSCLERFGKDGSQWCFSKESRLGNERPHLSQTIISCLGRCGRGVSRFSLNCHISRTNVRISHKRVVHLCEFSCVSRKRHVSRKNVRISRKRVVHLYEFSCVSRKRHVSRTNVRISHKRSVLHQMALLRDSPSDDVNSYTAPQCRQECIRIVTCL